MKKNLINLIILIITGLIPLKIFDYYQGDSRYLDKVQVPVFVFMIFGSILLTYLNHLNQKQAQKNRWWWIIFEVIGIVGFLYSGLILTMLFLFKDCCGF